MNAFWLAIALTFASAAEDRPVVLVVVGAPGTDDYAKQFGQWTERWRAAADRGQAECAVIGLDAEEKANDGEALKQRLAELAKSSSQPLWLILIGHGTFDGKTAKFNLRGPDVSSAELAEWLKPIERPLAIVNCASASGPFLNALSGPDRVVIAASKSGHEHNFARFGDYFSASIADPAADLDKDEQTSVLEAFLAAAARTADFYKEDSRLATEHALIDDNADGLGTPADWFRGVRAVKTAKDGASPDGLRAGRWQLVPSRSELELPAEVRGRRDELELEIAALRQRKMELPEDRYYAQLEPLVVELARLYEQFEASPGATAAPPSSASAE
ncbi:MAG TPA: hypothetical protein VMV10_24660 [Pirellulales bacterium]|nr:hypothetical protein [Pirellulales bacterium]